MQIIPGRPRAATKSSIRVRYLGMQMLHRPLAIKLLAPTVLVSLALVSVCLVGALHLNRLHVNVSQELSENVQSTRVADQLGATTIVLIELLRHEPKTPNFGTEAIERQNANAQEELDEAQSLANLEQEKILVQEIATGLATYFDGWNRRPTGPAAKIIEHDRSLAELLTTNVLRPCRELRAYNARQIEASDRENQSIVRTLRWGLLAVGVGAPISGLLLGYAVAKSLRHSIYQLSVGIRDAAGRLKRQVGSVTLDEQSDLPILHRQLQDVLGEIERVVQELQQREREVLRAEQLAAVGQVAAGVAHELRNPLTSVKMLVQTGLEGESSAGLAPEDLRIIEHEVRRMEQCIQMFLNFARPPRSERRPTNLNEIVQRALSLIEGRARRQNVTTETNLLSYPVVITADPEQVHQVLLNLLLNALDALPRGGTITVEMQILKQMPERNGVEHRAEGAIEIRIRDTGPGIAPRIRDRLFEPFVSSKETGLGLGLSICKRLVEAHGGTIRGENQPVNGAVFSFTLPMETSALR